MLTGASWTSGSRAAPSASGPRPNRSLTGGVVGLGVGRGAAVARAGCGLGFGGAVGVGREVGLASVAARGARGVGLPAGAAARSGTADRDGAVLPAFVPRIAPAPTTAASATATIRTGVPNEVVTVRVQERRDCGDSRTQSVPFQTMGAAPTSAARLAHGAPWLCVPGSRRVCLFASEACRVGRSRGGHFVPTRRGYQ